MRKRLDIIDEMRRDERGKARIKERQAFAASQLKWRDKNRIGQAQAAAGDAAEDRS
jgi:hypothetical protein